MSDGQRAANLSRTAWWLVLAAAVLLVVGLVLEQFALRNNRVVAPAGMMNVIGLVLAGWAMALLLRAWWHGEEAVAVLGAALVNTIMLAIVARVQRDGIVFRMLGIHVFVVCIIKVGIVAGVMALLAGLVRRWAEARRHWQARVFLALLGAGLVVLLPPALYVHSAVEPLFLPRQFLLSRTPDVVKHFAFVNVWEVNAIDRPGRRAERELEMLIRNGRLPVGTLDWALRQTYLNADGTNAGILIRQVEFGYVDIPAELRKAHGFPANSGARWRLPE